MFSNRIFFIAFTVSLAIHAIVLFLSFSLNVSANKRARNKVQVSYIKKADNFKIKESNKTRSLKTEPFFKLPDKIVAEKIIPPPFIDSTNTMSGNLPKDTLVQETMKPKVIKSDIYAIKKKITLPAINIDKINNPSYISYYQIVREKIRRSAYKNYIRNETGDVYITFIISNDGYLKNLRLVEDKSSTSIYLRASAIASVKDASPFPSFPKELDYPYLTFNVIISFEIE